VAVRAVSALGLVRKVLTDAIAQDAHSEQGRRGDQQGWAVEVHFG